MKQTQKCSKCDSNDVIFVRAMTMGYGSGNFIPIGFSIWSAVPVDRYVCAECGLVEEWIDKAYIQKLRDRYSE